MVNLHRVRSMTVVERTALVATVGDPGVFGNGREMAAWLGLVPRQGSTGGREKLPGISKRGDACLRTLPVHGARSVIRQQSRREKPDRQGRWIAALLERRHGNVTAVALANRMARIAWAVPATSEPCRTEEAMA